MKEKYGRPSLIHTFTEAARAAGEFLALKLTLPLLRQTAPGREGKPVLVIPGFAANDSTTLPLRQFLRDKGYTAYGWGNGVNWTFSKGNAEHIKNLLDTVFEKHGEKVSLIGHSLGGILARELARAFPDKIDQVITLGTAFGSIDHPDSSIYMIREVIEFLSDMKHVLKEENLAQLMLTPPPVPTTSLYTKSDGVVNWRTCLNPVTPRTENIEIAASHCGLIINPLAFLIIADRLAQEEGNWRPFEPAKYLIPFVSEKSGRACEPKIPPAGDHGPSPFFR